MTYKISQLSLNDPRHSLNSGEILVQPSLTGEGGDLLIVLETAANQTGDQELTRLFLEIAFEAYEHSQLHETEKKLENILAALNSQLPAQLAGLGKGGALSHNKNLQIQKSLNGLNCFVGLLEQNTLYFSSHGNVHAFLIRPTLQKKINTPGPETEGSKSLFDYTLTGQLKPGDRLLVANQSVLDYLSLEKIKKIISTLPPQSSTAHLGNILEAAPKTVSFFCLIAQMMAPSEAGEAEPKINYVKTAATASSKKSLDKMLLTQSETERILTPPSLWQVFKENMAERLKQNKKASASSLGSARDSKKTELTENRMTAAVRDKITKSLPRPKAPSWLKALARLTVKPAAIVWLTIVDPSRRARLTQNISGRVRGLIQFYNRLSKTHKVVILSVLALALIFSQSLIWQSQRAAKLALAQNFQEIVNKINEKKASIEAALIYDDDQRTRDLLAEIKQLTEQLPQATKDQIAQSQTIKNETVALAAKIWKIIEIPEPVSLINFREVNLTAEVSGISAKDDYIFAFSNQNQIMAINVSNNNTLVLEDFTLRARAEAFFPRINNLIIATEDNKFFTLENNQLRDLKVQLPSNFTKTDGLTFYLDKMYLLDKTAGQIFRLTYSGSEFRSTQAWLKPAALETVKANEIVSLAIDGVIYALKPDGTIVKLASGLSQGELKPKIEPAFIAAAKIYTNDKTDNLYILEPANQRLVVLNKQDGLKVQYHSDKFNNLKDFIVSGDEKKIYLLNGSQIYVIAAQE
ncbi:MAG: hypothetical protein Q8P32_02995 [Candidatus Komeilibacteria bacterium]|nr:hypothetical protein [Candidatus Komeilibacteria bacterium]